jgi:hypothetical protein
MEELLTERQTRAGRANSGINSQARPLASSGTDRCAIDTRRQTYPKHAGPDFDVFPVQSSPDVTVSRTSNAKAPVASQDRIPYLWPCFSPLGAAVQSLRQWESLAVLGSVMARDCQNGRALNVVRTIVWQCVIGLRSNVSVKSVICSRAMNERCRIDSAGGRVLSRSEE